VLIYLYERILVEERLYSLACGEFLLFFFHFLLLLF
jgi:hypothetical protein